MSWSGFLTGLITITILYNIVVVYLYFKADVADFFRSSKSKQAEDNKEETKVARQPAKNFVGAIKGEQKAFEPKVEQNKTTEPQRRETSDEPNKEKNTQEPVKENEPAENIGQDPASLPMSIRNLDNGYLIEDLSQAISIEKENFKTKHLKESTTTLFSEVISPDDKGITASIETDNEPMETEIESVNTVNFI